jgi:hypothetical protein
MKQQLVKYTTTVRDVTLDLPLQQALFPVCHDVHPHWAPRVLKRAFHPEDRGDMFLRNVGYYKNHTSSYPIQQNSSWLQTFTDVNTPQLRKAACYNISDNSMLNITSSECLF